MFNWYLLDLSWEKEKKSAKKYDEINIKTANYLLIIPEKLEMR